MSKIFDQVCLIDGALGINIPKEFALQHNMTDWGVDTEDMIILLAGPENEHYWETWDRILNDASIIIDGETWRLSQDNDLFAVRMEE